MRLDFEQRQIAMLLAESRGIDEETAQELVYLRAKVIKFSTLERLLIEVLEAAKATDGYIGQNGQLGKQINAALTEQHAG